MTHRRNPARGPRDGVPIHAEHAGLVELEVDGLRHRYIPTHQRRTDGDAERMIYTYDGVVDPDGALDARSTRGNGRPSRWPTSSRFESRAAHCCRPDTHEAVRTGSGLA